MKRQAITRIFLAGATATALLTGAAHAEPPTAQEDPAATQSQSGQAATAPSQSAPMEEVTDKQLEKFVDAATDVQEVQATYAQRMQEAQDQEQAQSLRDEAQSEMVGAVEESGLSVQEFNLIAQRLQTDPELAERLKQIRGS